MITLQDLKDMGHAPEWLQPEGLQTLSKGYFQNGETPREMYVRVASACAYRLNKSEFANAFFDIMWKGWVCPASPIVANMGSDYGLPISCNGATIGDSLDSILLKNREVGLLAKYGAGVSGYLGLLRARGALVNGTGGMSDGITAWAKIFDSSIHSINQGSTRRGAMSVYTDVTHGDIDEFLQMRRTTGDANKRCMNLHHGVCIPDEFMHSLGDKTSTRNRHLWEEMLTTRVETGEPYLFFTDNVNKANPPWIKNRGLRVDASQLCTEIMLPSDVDHTFVCCLLSMNLHKWEEWKDTDAVYLATLMLDGVMEEYIEKAKLIPGFENAVRFSEKARSLGVGVLGWHSLLQSKMIAFDSFDAMMLNSQIFRRLQSETILASEWLAKEYGEPEWCKGSGRRNTHLMAVAPTVSNSLISGAVSAGIEPWPANIFVDKAAKGVFIRKNKELQKLLAGRNQDNDEVWNQINKDAGSVQNLKCLTSEEKTVFLTAREINQFAIIKQAAQRQKWIDQGQSVNLFFATNADPKYIHEVHLEAWKQGLKSLYYLRSESVLRADLATRSADECTACEA